MINIDGPKNPTYSVTLRFDDITYEDLLDLKEAMACMGSRYSQIEYNVLKDFIESKGP